MDFVSRRWAFPEAPLTYKFNKCMHLFALQKCGCPWAKRHTLWLLLYVWHIPYLRVYKRSRLNLSPDKLPPCLFHHYSPRYNKGNVIEMSWINRHFSYSNDFARPFKRLRLNIMHGLLQTSSLTNCALNWKYIYHRAFLWIACQIYWWKCIITSWSSNGPAILIHEFQCAIEVHVFFSKFSELKD